MMGLRRKSKILGLALVGVTLLGFLQACSIPSSEESCYFIQNKYGRRVSWGENLPIKLYVHESVPAKFHDDITNAVDQWNKSMGRLAFDLVSFYVVEPSMPRRDGYSIIYWLSTWEASEDRAKEQGRTTVHWRGDRIHEADIRINGKNFKYFSGAEERGLNSGKVHFRSLVVHEEGHMLGLAHNNEKGSMMRPELSLGLVRDTIGFVDKASLSCEYDTPLR